MSDGRAALRRLSALALLTLVGLALSGCANLAFYWQSVSGHVAILRAARPIDNWLNDATTSAPVRARLQLAQSIRAYAVTSLHLPDNASYHRYADLHRPAAVWNVVAAPVDSLTLKTWCFVVVGCVAYRGYYDPAAAQTLAQQLRQEGRETSVYGVPAYSTLGWMNWAGGDPLLSTFINLPDGELARLIFHELAHQVVFVAGDTTFNESFATAVERLGSQRWLKEQGSVAAQRDYAEFDARRNQFRALTLATRERLAAAYAEPGRAANWPTQKAQVLQSFRDQYALLKSSWQVDSSKVAGYDAWVAKANNAAFGAQAAYDDQVPAFEAMFERISRTEADPWPAFYDAVKQLAKMPGPARGRALQQLKETTGG